MPGTDRAQHGPLADTIVKSVILPLTSASLVAKGQALHAHHRSVVLPTRAVGIAMVEVLLLLLR